MRNSKILQNLLIAGCLLILILVSCKLFEKEDPKPIEVYGCMDSTATNYKPDATVDDGSCDYCKEGSSFILLSTNAGINWNLLCLKEKIGRVSDISIIDSNNIWLCTYANANVSYAQIMHTSDGGRTWVEQYSFDNSVIGQVSFEYIEMFDLNNGIALVNDTNNKTPLFLKTHDGGNNWIQTTSDAIGISGNIWRRVDFVNVNVGYFFESLVNPQKLYKTTNSGVTWQETNFDGYAYVLKFYNEDIGLIAGNNGNYRTIDGGLTWQHIENPYTVWANDIEFDPNDPSRVWMLSDSLFFSDDTGSTWDFCFDNTYNGSDAICFSQSSLWVYNMGRYLRNVDIDNCDSYIEHHLPEYTYGDLSLGYDFDVEGNVIVIPGQFSE